MTDLNLIDKGEDYKKLPQNIVIFICTFDLFGKNRYIYRFENRCIEDNDVVLGDGTTKIFLNTKGTVGEISEELRALLEYIDNGTISDNYTSKLNQEVFSAKNSTKWRLEYMTLDMMIKEEREDALTEGITIGEEFGRLYTLFEMYDEKDITLQRVMEKSGLNEEEFNLKFEEWKTNR